MATTKDTHTANGSEDTFGFTFPYIKQSDVKVNVDNVIVSTDDYSFSDATHVQFNTAPANGKSIDIYRSTADTNLVATFYPGSAIRSADLNDNFTQNLYTTQETTNDSALALDNSRELSSGVYTSAISIANTAKTTSTEAKEDADDAIAATNALVATNSGTDSEPVWVLQGDGSNTTTNNKGVKYAVEEAEDAVSTANDAATDATNALNNSRKADGVDPAAPSGGYTSAIYLANQADGNATTALSNSRDSEGTSAISIAEDAKITADAAQVAVSNSTTYNLKNNKTAFEAVTFTAEIDGQASHKAWEITDSTGITSSYTSFTDNAGSGTAKTVTGVPSDFTGDSGLSARFNYTHSTNTFAWAGYWVNDAEDRYGGSIVQNLREITTNFTLKDTMNGFSIGPVIINSAATITIPENSKYVVMN